MVVKKVIIILSGVTYHSMKQRPQHMADYFSSQGYLVIYLALVGETAVLQTEEFEKMTFETLLTRFSEEVKPNLYVMKRVFKREKNDEIRLDELFVKLEREIGTNNIVIIASFPDWMDHLSKVSEKVKLIYDCLDDWESFVTELDWNYNNSLIHNERKLASISDLVLVSARRLYAKMAVLTKNIYYLPNGVWNKDYKNSNSIGQVPSDIKNIPKPIVFFMGAIAGWVDIDLIDFISKQRPDYSFVFVGSEIKRKLPKNDNIYFLGSKKYEELPKYLSQARVAIIPFKVNNLTAAVTPLKYYEYLSAGVPTVTTMLPDLLGLSGSKVALNYQDFLENIDRYVEMSEEEYQQESMLARCTSYSFDWSILLNPLCSYIDNHEFSIIENREFIEKTVDLYKGYVENNVIRNELLSLYNLLGEYNAASELFEWEEVCEGKLSIDYQQLALTYIELGEIEKAVTLTNILLRSRGNMIYYQNYFNSLQDSPKAELLIKAFILKLCGRQYEALQLLDSTINDDLETLGLISSLYFDIGEYELGLNYAIKALNYSHEAIITRFLDPYCIIEIISYLMKHGEYKKAEELAFGLYNCGMKDKAIEILGDIYLVKYTPLEER
jgi:tetratricopeptide (TPR) repeat protein